MALSAGNVKMFILKVCYDHLCRGGGKVQKFKSMVVKAWTSDRAPRIAISSPYPKSKAQRLKSVVCTYSLQSRVSRGRGGTPLPPVFVRARESVQLTHHGRSSCHRELRQGGAWRSGSCESGIGL